MPRTTVRCVWRLFYEDDFYEAVQLCRTLGCLLWPEFPGDYDDDGCLLMAVIITADDEKFLFSYGNMLNLYSDVECCACDIIEFPNNLRPERSVERILGGNQAMRVLVSALCVQNRAVQNDSVLWFQAYWSSDWIKTLNIEALALAIQDPQAVVFYRITSKLFPLSPPTSNAPDLLTIKFYFKLVKFPGFRTWLRKARTTLPLNLITLLTDHNHHSGRTPDFEAIQSYPQLTPETLDTFLQAIGMR